MKMMGALARVVSAAVMMVTLLVAPSRGEAAFLNRFRTMEAKDVLYGLTNEERADIYRLPGRNHPAIIFIHGGGWHSGDKAGYAFYAKKLNAKGIAAIAINYRLLSLTTGLNPWPAQIEDAQLAVRWLRAHADALGIDPDRICAWGDSAGGHLALLLGSMKTSKLGDRSHLYADKSSAVSCVINMFGATHMKKLDLAGMPGILKTLFGGKTPAQAPRVYDEASPALIVHVASAPTYTVHGTRDEIIPFSQAEELHQALNKNRVLNTLVPFRGGHWFLGIQPASRIEELNDAMIDYAVKTLKP